MLHRRCVVWVTLCGSMLTACAEVPPAWRGQSGSPTMPDPGGCYVLVYDGPRFTGAREYLNGPAMHRRLTELPFGSNWRDRIRSARVGPLSTVTMWTNEGLVGASQRLASNTEHASLDERVSGSVESLEIMCARPS